MPLYERLDALLNERDVALANGDPDPGYPPELLDETVRADFRDWQADRLAAVAGREFGAVPTADLP